jgi:hypothetical protein
VIKNNVTLYLVSRAAGACGVGKNAGKAGYPGQQALFASPVHLF